jgi:ABC-type amino acid transport substrate-binding protein
MKTGTLALLLAASLAACSDIPKDTEGSLEQIRETKTFRVGLIAGSQDGEGRGRRLIDAVASEAGATPAITTGAAEHLLTQLEEGELDLVVGTMANKSPWALKVHASKPLVPAAERAPTSLVALARNGENAWISLLHRQVERVRGKP